MAKTLLIRMASAVALVALSFLFVALNPVLGTSQNGANGIGRTPTMSINRMLKGDRLPLPSDVNSTISRNEPQSKLPRRLPLGCDGAFSPISAPSLAHIYGRCAT